MEFINGLYQNPKSLTLKEAKHTNLRDILLMRYRVCEVCKKSFDITNEGIFYRCCK
mgnify:CR=1 FL=1|tara:strand:- start:13884 stop:14051 length:168 start_codon:yes stop_codon:yes gene_type:complete